MNLDHPDMEKAVLKAARLANEEQRKLMKNEAKEKILEELNHFKLTMLDGTFKGCTFYRDRLDESFKHFISKALDSYVIAVVGEGKDPKKDYSLPANGWDTEGWNAHRTQTLKNAGIIE